MAEHCPDCQWEGIDGAFQFYWRLHAPEDTPQRFDPEMLPVFLAKGAIALYVTGCIHHAMQHLSSSERARFYSPRLTV